MLGPTLAPPLFVQIPLPAITIIYQPHSLVAYLQLTSFTRSNALYGESYSCLDLHFLFKSQFNSYLHGGRGPTLCYHLFAEIPTKLKSRLLGSGLLHLHLCFFKSVLDSYLWGGPLCHWRHKPLSPLYVLTTKFITLPTAQVRFH